MRSDDEDLRAALADVLVRLVRIEELLTTLRGRAGVLLDDVWWLRDEWQRQGYAGVDRRRRVPRGSGCAAVGSVGEGRHPSAG